MRLSGLATAGVLAVWAPLAGAAGSPPVTTSIEASWPAADLVTQYLYVRTDHCEAVRGLTMYPAERPSRSKPRTASSPRSTTSSSTRIRTEPVNIRMYGRPPSIRRRSMLRKASIRSLRQKANSGGTKRSRCSTPRWQDPLSSSANAAYSTVCTSPSRIAKRAYG